MSAQTINDIEGHVHYSNAQWVVTDYGIESLAEQGGWELVRTQILKRFSTTKTPAAGGRRSPPQ